MTDRILHGNVTRNRTAAACAYALILLGALALPAAAIRAEPLAPSGSVLDAARSLRPGEYLWAPEVAPRGPLLLIVSLATQRAILYRNGIPIAITTVSTGRSGHVTPTGVFTILQRDVDHRSNIYDNAPMPYMQRLTWGGVALHGGALPGYPASHGCIRLPHEFAKRLYGVTRLGMTVIITEKASVPRIAPGDPVAWDGGGKPGEAADWHPERAASGPVSIVISAADQRTVVLRNGIVIGSAPTRIDAPITATSVFVRTDTVTGSSGWIRVQLPEWLAAPAAEDLTGRIHVAPEFRAAVEPLLGPGANVIITGDSLGAGAAAASFRIEDDAEEPRPE